MSFGSGQLPLAVGLKRRTLLENFIAGENASALAALHALLDILCLGQQKKPEPLLYFWGRPATGKSHLLLGACDRITEAGLTPAYLCLSDPKSIDPAMLEGLEELDLVCLDNIQGIAGLAIWEESLFDLFNRLRASSTPLLVSADISPHNLSIQLPDLKSRLTWGATFHLTSLSDEHRQKVLTLAAFQLGMTLTPQAADYLLRHYSRDLNQLFEFLDQLDTATLASKRKPTIPFLKQLIPEVELEKMSRSQN